MDKVAEPVCTVCGTQVYAGIRALKFDRCGDPNKWKYIKCLAADAYDMLIENKELFSFCHECKLSEDVVKIKDDKEDKVVGLFEKLMDKLCLLEDGLNEKVNVNPPMPKEVIKTTPCCGLL